MQRNKQIEEEIESDVKNLIEKIASYYEIDEKSDIKNSPKRIVKMFTEELFRGYYEDPKKYLKLFEEENEGILTIENIPVKSLCEHHFLPMYGFADIVVKYKKNAKILGLSKYYRIVDNFSRKLQLQERLTKEIANFLYENLELEGLIVRIKCDHFCVKMRGVDVEIGQAASVVAKGLFEGNYKEYLK